MKPVRRSIPSHVLTVNFLEGVHLDDSPPCAGDTVEIDYQVDSEFDQVERSLDLPMEVGLGYHLAKPQHSDYFEKTTNLENRKQSSEQIIPK